MMMESWVGGDSGGHHLIPACRGHHLPLPADTVSLKLPEVDDNLSSYEKDLFIFHFNFKHFTDMRLLFIDNLSHSDQKKFRAPT